MSNDSPGDSPYGHRPPPPDKSPVDSSNPYTSGSEYASTSPQHTHVPGYIRLKPHRGGAVLALGLTGSLMALITGVMAIMFYICCPLFLLPLLSLSLSIPAWVMGQSDLAAMNAGTMDPSGRDITMIGMITGIVGTAVVALGVLAFIAMVVFAFGVAILSGN